MQVLQSTFRQPVVIRGTNLVLGPTKQFPLPDPFNPMEAPAIVHPEAIRWCG
jgi:hypothetical protein